MTPTVEPVSLAIIGPQGPGPAAVHGFGYFWLKYVRGFNPAVHCGSCLLGHYSKAVTAWKAKGKAPVLFPGEPLPLNEVQGWDFLYLCGNTFDWPKNLHVAVAPKAGETVDVVMPHDPRYRVVLANAVRLEIPDLPDGYAGKPRDFTTCRNWRFGMAYYPPGEDRRWGELLLASR